MFTPLPVPNDSQVQYYMRQACQLVKDVTILGWPIVLNPAVAPSQTVAIGFDHPLCITGGNEIHMNRSCYSALALPDNMALCEAMVMRCMVLLKTFRVVAIIGRDKFYARLDGKAQPSTEGAFATQIRAKADRFVEAINHVSFWLDSPITWTIEETPDFDANGRSLSQRG